jgi:cytoskeletal protein CcmA (bactofilin family)
MNFMWWEKKARPAEETPAARPDEAPPPPPEEERPMSEPTNKSTIPSASGGQRTVLGRTVVAQGQLTSGEDIVIEGQFDGTISLNDHCLTIGAEGRVKAEIRARQVIIQGSVTGNVEAREKIDIRRTGHVVGDLVASTVAIEEGAYFKGSIDIARGEAAGASNSAYTND